MNKIQLVEQLKRIFLHVKNYHLAVVFFLLNIEFTCVIQLQKARTATENLILSTPNMKYLFNDCRFNKKHKISNKKKTNLVKPCFIFEKKVVKVINCFVVSKQLAI